MCPSPTAMPIRAICTSRSAPSGPHEAWKANRVKTMNDRLVWIDCEMTGLDLGGDALIEIAALVTDGELNILDEGVDVVIKPPEESLRRMITVVRDMHTASGLLEELP